MNIDEKFDARLELKLKKAQNRALIQGALVKYFKDKGVRADQKVYPPSMQDLIARTPELATKVEIVPYVTDVNAITGEVTIGWNLFVLGTVRMFLGTSVHQSATDLERAVYGAPNPSSQFESDQTPADIIRFVVRELSKKTAGRVSANAGQLQPDSLVDPNSVANRPRLGPTMSGGYYEKNKPAG